MISDIQIDVELSWLEKQDNQSFALRVKNVVITANVDTRKITTEICHECGDKCEWDWNRFMYFLQ